MMKNTNLSRVLVELRKNFLTDTFRDFSNNSFFCLHKKRPCLVENIPFEFQKTYIERLIKFLIPNIIILYKKF